MKRVGQVGNVEILESECIDDNQAYLIADVTVVKKFFYTPFQQGYICGFAAVNNGKHCIINGHCIVCRKEQI